MFCIGFLIVYLADELLHFFCGEAIQHHHVDGSLSDSDPILPTPTDSDPILPTHSHSHASYGTNSEVVIPKEEQAGKSAVTQHQLLHDAEDENINARICHTSHNEPCVQTLAGTIGIIFSLSIHSLLEGLAIGIQDTASKVMILFTVNIMNFLHIDEATFLLFFCVYLYRPLSLISLSWRSYWELN